MHNINVEPLSASVFSSSRWASTRTPYDSEYFSNPSKISVFVHLESWLVRCSFLFRQKFFLFISFLFFPQLFFLVFSKFCLYLNSVKIVIVKSNTFVILLEKFVILVVNICSLVFSDSEFEFIISLFVFHPVS